MEGMQYNIKHSLHPERGEMETEKGVLIIKVKTLMKYEDLHNLRKKFIEQAKEGIIVLPEWCEFKFGNMSGSYEIDIRKEGGAWAD